MVMPTIGEKLAALETEAPGLLTCAECGVKQRAGQHFWQLIEGESMHYCPPCAAKALRPFFFTIREGRPELAVCIEGWDVDYV
jgi:hypothetical protein